MGEPLFRTESLKSARASHNLLVAALAAIGAFSIGQTSQDTDVTATLKNLTQLEYEKYREYATNAAKNAIEKSKLPSEVMEQFRKATDADEQQKQLVEKALKAMLTDLADPPWHSAPEPPPDADISTLLTFMRSEPKVQITLPDQAKLLSGIEYASKFMITHKPWTEVKIEPIQRDRTRRRFTVSISAKGVGADTSNINHVEARDVPISESFTSWIKTMPELGLITIEAGGYVFLPALSPPHQWNKVSAKTPQQALEAISESTDKQSLKVAGMSINAAVAIILAPLLSLVLATHFWSMASHLARFTTNECADIAAFPWIGVSQTRLADPLLHASLLVLPAATLILLLATAWPFTSALPRVIGTVLAIAVILVCFVAWHQIFYSVRARLRVDDGGKLVSLRSYWSFVLLRLPSRSRRVIGTPDGRDPGTYRAW